MDITPVNAAYGSQIAQAIHGGADESSTTVSVVEELPLQRHRDTVFLCPFRESGDLTLDRVRGCLLLARNPRVECGSNLVHVASWKEAARRLRRNQARTVTFESVW